MTNEQYLARLKEALEKSNYGHSRHMILGRRAKSTRCFSEKTDGSAKIDD